MFISGARSFLHVIPTVIRPCFCEEVKIVVHMRVGFVSFIWFNFGMGYTNKRNSPSFPSFGGFGIIDVTYIDISFIFIILAGEFKERNSCMLNILGFYSLRL